MATSLAQLFGAVFPAKENTTDRASPYGPTFGEVGSPVAIVGTFAFNAEADVRAGTQYGANGEFTGTLDVNAEGDMPAITDVRDGVSYSSGSLVGVLVLPLPESRVLENIGYGANATEYVGTLSVAGGGGGQVDPVVDERGQINSPLIIGRDYLHQYGMGFVWRLQLDFDAAASGVGKFRGRAQPCTASTTCPTTYDWDVEDLSITKVDIAGTDYYDFVFELTEAETSVLIPGMYDWWVTWEAVTGEEIQLQDGEVEWVCG